MLGLTSLGIVHTAIGLIAVAAGFVALARDRAIRVATGAGKVYLWTTLLTVLTGFGIFQHGGFGKPHALGVLTLLVIGAAELARRSTVFGRAAAYVETIGYSTTFFFHFIPAITETLTRVPVGAPLVSHAEAAIVQRCVGVVFAVYLVGVVLQWRALRVARREGGASMLAVPARRTS